jgi:FkbM family methyltransferase
MDTIGGAVSSGGTTAIVRTRRAWSGPQLETSLLNSLKRLLFYFCILFQTKFPYERGKYRLAYLVYRLFGLATYRIGEILIELNPISIIDQKLLAGELHDSVVHQAIDACLKDGGTFIDVGANNGYFSLIAATRKGVRVFAFEPSPRELARFYRNIWLNGLSNITVLPFGLSRRVEMLRLNLAADHNPGMNTVNDLAEFQSYARSLDRSFTTLDAILSPTVLQDVRLFKIDVEGFEMSVLEGMEKSIPAMSKATFVVEITASFLVKCGHSPVDIYRFFERHGYRPRFGLTQVLQYDEVFEKE